MGWRPLCPPTATQGMTSPRRFLRVTVFASLLLAILPTTGTAGLERARSLGNGQYELTGDFGARCRACEVVFAYPDGLRYAHRILTWSPRRIVVEAPDLNRSANVTVTVRTAAGISKPLSLRLARTIVPPRDFSQAVTNSVARQYGFFEYTHQLAVGDKGEDTLDVSAGPPGCGQSAKVFERAEVVYKDQRFGQAQIVSTPPAGCVRCAPLRVRWYHEPTGRLTYQVHVYRRVVEGICPDRVR